MFLTTRLMWESAEEAAAGLVTMTLWLLPLTDLTGCWLLDDKMRSWSSEATPTLFTLPVRKVRVHTQLSGPPKQEVLMSIMSDKCFHSRSTFTQQLISGNFSSLYVSDCRHMQFFSFLYRSRLSRVTSLWRKQLRVTYLRWTRCWVQLLRWRASAILGRASCPASAGWAQPSDSGQSCAAWVWAPLSPSLQRTEMVQTRF